LVNRLAQKCRASNKAHNNQWITDSPKLRAEQEKSLCGGDLRGVLVIHSQTYPQFLWILWKPFAGLGDWAGNLK
jgi:hypothetical protein